MPAATNTMPEEMQNTASDVLHSMGIGAYDRHKHAALVSELDEKVKARNELAKEFNDRAASDKWTDADMSRYMTNKGKLDVLTSEIADLRAQERGMVKVMPEMVKAKQDLMTDRFVRRGVNGLTAEERKEFGVDGDALQGHVDSSLLVGSGVEGLRISVAEMHARREVERRVLAQTRSDDASGQELVQETVVPDVIQRLAFGGGGVLDLCYTFMTSSGNEWKVNQFDEATTRGVRLGDQDTTIVANDLANFEVVTFRAQQVTSGFIPITRDAIADSVVDLQAFGEFQGGRRIQKSNEYEFTLNGDGTGNNPQAVKIGAADGPTTKTANVLVYKDMSANKRSVNRAYRVGGEMGAYGAVAKQGKLGWLFSDPVEGLLEDMTDSENRPMWLPSIRDGEPNTILGYPYAVAADDSIDTTLSTTGDKCIAFGNWNYFAHRQIAEYEMFRFQDSQTMAKNSIWLLVLTRNDFRAVGAIVNGKTEAVKWLLNK